MMMKVFINLSQINLNKSMKSHSKTQSKVIVTFNHYLLKKTIKQKLAFFSVITALISLKILLKYTPNCSKLTQICSSSWKPMTTLILPRTFIWRCTGLRRIIKVLFKKLYLRRSKNGCTQTIPMLAES